MADQNQRDFGDNFRLLTSGERTTLFRILSSLSKEELKELSETSPYYNLLDSKQARLDNIIL